MFVHSTETQQLGQDQLFINVFALDINTRLVFLQKKKLLSHGADVLPVTSVELSTETC